MPGSRDCNGKRPASGGDLECKARRLMINARLMRFEKKLPTTAGATAIETAATATEATEATSGRASAATEAATAPR